MKITISFKQNEKDLYDFLISKRSSSIYIKDLLEKEKDKDSCNRQIDSKSDF
ncbi:MAG: hypothetical protein ACLS28_24165 [Clostridium neonatale]